MVGSPQNHILIVRLATATFGVAAIAWAVAAFPAAWPQQRLAEVAARVLAGDVYRPAVIEALSAEADRDQALSQRSLSLRDIAIVRLRRAELAIASGDRERIDSSLKSLHDSVGNALANAPGDAFLWVVLFWLENNRDGFKPENLRYLQMSYRRGPYEGWIAVNRNRFALAIFPLLPEDLAEAAISEFAGLVRSRLYYQQAADLIAGPGWPIRHILLSRLKDLKEQERRNFARVLAAKGIDDVSALGIEPPQRPWR